MDKKLFNSKQIIEFIKNTPAGFPFFAVSNGKKYRAKIEPDNTVFVYEHSCKTYGYRFSSERFARYYTVIIPEQKDETVEWHNNIVKALVCLDGSGIWLNVKEAFSSILSSGMSKSDHLGLCSLYKDYRFKQKNDVCTSDSFERFLHKYPFAFQESNGGTMRLNPLYVSEVSNCKLKCMYFGKSNAKVKENIINAVLTKTNYSIPMVATSYDVSFVYDASKGKAWYAEKFRNSEKGHYYIALNHNTALFWKNV